MPLLNAATLSACGKTAEGDAMKLLTSLGRREEGHLGHEVVSLALVIFAILGAMSLLGRLG
jgi:hypothetical protein